MDRIANLIRSVPDFPKKGILFRDITPVLLDFQAFQDVLLEFDRVISDSIEGRVDKVAGIESRGFILAPAMALSLEVGFIPIRKKGKLPMETFGTDVFLEYGKDAIEMHKDAVSQGERVLIVDDVLATGGTASAAARLVEACGGTVAGFAFLAEITELAGRDRLKGYHVESLVKF